jgi:hypothetical protein
MHQTPKIGSNRKLSLKKLARDLAINMVDLATNDQEFDDANKYFLTKTLVKEKKERRVRNILIIGAGASTNANEKIHSAAEVVKDLYTNFVNTDNLQKWVTHIHTKAEEKLPGLDTESFEFKLNTLQSMLWEKDLKQEFRTRLGYKHIPSLFYEIVGHMFKHRLIDVIINFNFDEILDAVIAEEMGDGEYSKIVMNGDCPDKFSDLYLGNKLRAPIYIKPHGTISHAGTLKFTYDHYSDGNVTIKTLLSDLFSDSHEENGNSLEMNIISAGYSYSDPDLHKLLQKANTNQLKIINYYIFDYKEQTEYFEKNTFWKNLKARPFYKEAKNPDLGEVFNEVWREMTQNFKPIFRDKYPKGIERHKIIAGLFQNNRPNPIRYFIEKDDVGAAENKKGYITYIRSRIFVEIAIVLAQSQGLVHINQFRSSRLRNYFGLLHEIDGTDNLENSLDHFLSRFGFVEPYMKVMRDTYQISPAWLDRKTSKILIPELLSKLAALIDKPEVALGNYPHWFEKIANNTLCVVNSDIKEYYLSPFSTVSKGNLLFNDMRWLYSMGQEFQSKEWNAVLAISERGDIIWDQVYRRAVRRNKAAIWAILADHRIDRQENDLSHKRASKFKGLKLRVEYLPWEMHNKHMYIFLNIPDDESREIQFIKGIYYVRRLLTNVVNPVILSKESDVKILFDYFCSYWQKAQSYNKLGYDRLRLNETGFKNIEKEILSQLRMDAKIQANRSLKNWTLTDIEKARLKIKSLEGSNRLPH